MWRRQAALALNGTAGVQASGKGPSSYTAQLPTPTGRSVQQGDRRETEQTAPPAGEEETRRLAEESSTSDEQQIESSGEKEAKEIESAASNQEMTDSKQAQYSRWTGQLIGAAGRETTQRRPGGGQSQGRTRTR